MYPDSKILHIIVAAGSGSRFGSELPKQFCDLCGLPVVMHAINTLRSHSCGAEVVLVINEGMHQVWDRLCKLHSFASPAIVYGGATRWQSVKNAIGSHGASADIITVHDGARPLLSHALISRVLDAVQSGCRAVIPAVAVTDSLRVIDSGGNHAVNRADFRAVQTPQAFDGALLREAYSQPELPTFTDDASVAESIGAGVTIVEGEPTNIKITHPFDIAVARLILEQ